jgi:beta-galactosidase/beta-glucuronidase
MDHLVFLLFDIQKTKQWGFNTICKHVKVEPARWYYHCDREGVLVWQDMPSSKHEAGKCNTSKASMPHPDDHSAHGGIRPQLLPRMERNNGPVRLSSLRRHLGSLQ